MDALLGQNPVLGGVFKVSVGLLTSLFVWRMRRHRSVLALLLGMFLFYTALIGYHVYGIVCTAGAMLP